VEVFNQTRPGPPPGAGVVEEVGVAALLLGEGAAGGVGLAGAAAGAAGAAAVAGAALVDAYQVFTPLWPRQAPLLLAPVQ
jgi:hypothetical protein